MGANGTTPEQIQFGQAQLRAAVGDIAAFYSEAANVIQETGRAIATELRRDGIEAIRASVEIKSDGSPVSRVDKLANDVLTAGLRKCSPFPIVSEEDPRGPLAVNEALGASFFWLADPLDGTRDFLAGENTFAVAVALMRVTATPSGEKVATPWFGSIVDPIGATESGMEAMWWSALGEPLAKRTLTGEKTFAKRTPRDPAKPLRVLGSRSILSERMQSLYDFWGINEITRIGSALKFALIAEGKFDVYPRFGPTSEWDTAAGQVLLQATGGDVVSLETFQSMAYAKPRWHNHGFLAVGERELATTWEPRLKAAIKSNLKRP